MRYYVIEVFDTAEKFTESDALFVLSREFHGEVLNVQEMGAHPIHQTMHQGLISIGVNGNELDFDSAEYANDILNKARLTPRALDRGDSAVNVALSTPEGYTGKAGDTQPAPGK